MAFVLPVSCVALLLLAAAPQLVQSFPSGPPVEDHFDQVCDLMTPLHHGAVPIASTGGFSIETDLPRNGYKGFNYTAGSNYTGDY